MLLGLTFQLTELGSSRDQLLLDLALLLCDFLVQVDDAHGIDGLSGIEREFQRKLVPPIQESRRHRIPEAWHLLDSAPRDNNTPIPTARSIRDARANTGFAGRHRDR
jgi:hypothetical protein